MSYLKFSWILPAALTVITAKAENVDRQDKKTNVIYILCDDLGYGELGFRGQTKIQTPELDKLAENGMQFVDHYCGNSVSAASRCCLMTGLHPGHAYIRANSPGYPKGQTPLPANSETVAKLMKRAGYTTACIGKWGLGSFWDEGSPMKQGFDHFYGYTDQVRAHEYYTDYLWKDGKKQPLNKKGERKYYSHDLFTEDALNFIDKNAQNPFFLYLAYTIPHVKYQVPDLAQYKDKPWPENMKIHAAMTSRMDRDIGTIVRLLEKLKIADNTLIIFSSDNGAHGASNSIPFFNITANLRGHKRSMFEGGVRTPTLAYWPKHVPAGTVSDHMSAFWDLLPTLSDLTGEPIKGKTDGISFLPTLLGQPSLQEKHKYLYWELYESGKPNCAVRWKNWKGVVLDRRKGLNVLLYDMTKDESERTNVADQHPEVVKEMQEMMREAHVDNPYWSKENKPLYNAAKACKDHGVTFKTKKKKK